MYVNKEEQQIINIFQELLNKYDKQGTREVRDGHTRVSLFGKQCRFDLSKSFPLLTHRQHFARAAFEEVMWYLRGQTDNQILKDKNVHVWDLWEGQIDPKNPTELGKIYGHMFRKFGEVDEYKPYFNYNGDYIPERSSHTFVKGFDQIAWLLNEIKVNPNSSRLILSNWDPKVSTKTPKEAVLPCCLTLLQFHVEELSESERKRWLDANYEGGGLKAIVDYCDTGVDVEDEYRKEEIQEHGFGNLLNHYSVPKAKLSSQLYQRSSDCTVAGGWNITQMCLLTHLIAQQSDLAVGYFVWTTGDIHFYGDQVEDVRVMASRPTHPFPQIKINKAKDIFSYEWSDIEVIGYQHSGKIENLKVSL